MKLGGPEIARYLAKPDPSRPGVLIYGEDAVKVSETRIAVVSALTGPDAADEMRLARISAADLRRDPGWLPTAVRAVSFFPGQRAVIVDDATDGLAPVFAEAMRDWQQGDAVVIATAGRLTKASALRKLFEAHPAAVIVPLYDTPPTADEVSRQLADAGLQQVPQDTLRELVVLARAVDMGEFARTIEKIALYKLNDPSPLSIEEVGLLAPMTLDGEVDEVIHLAAEGRPEQMLAYLQRISGAGTRGVTLAIAATRHFRSLHMAANDPQGAESGLARQRPPVFGPRRDRMARQARQWGSAALEEALNVLVRTDLELRSGGNAPEMAVIERAFLRLAMRVRQR